MKVHVEFDKRKVINRHAKAMELVQYRLDSQVIKDSNGFAPRDRGDLQESAVIHSSVGKGELVWRTPYARRLYYNPQYNFSKDKNPNAQGLWFEVAKRVKLSEWLMMANDAFRRVF